MSRILTVHIFLLQETQKRPAKTELGKRAKKQKVNNVRTAKSTSAGTAKSVRNNKSANVNTNKLTNVDTNKLANVDTNKSANVGTNKLARTKKSTNVDINNSAIVGTNKSPNVGTNNSAYVGTNKSSSVGTSKSANIGTIKSANVETIKLMKASKTTQRGNKSPMPQRKPGTGRKGKRVVSPRNSKKTTTKTKPKRASRSLVKERTKKGVNGTTAIAPEDINSEQREHVDDDEELSEDNSEDNLPLTHTKSSPKQNGTVEGNGEVTDFDSITSIRRDEQLTHENTVPSAGSDSDTQDADHESNMQAPESIETGPHTLDEESSSATESSSGSERSCTPLSNYIANKSGKGCKITIKKTSYGFIFGDECGVDSRQHGQSGACCEKAKSRKSVVPESTAMTAIASGVVEDCTTDGSTVDHDVVSHTKSDTNTDVVSDSEVGGPSESTLSDVVSVCKTDKTVVDSASCCKTDSSSEICDIAPRCKMDSDTLDSRCEADAPAVIDAMSDYETGGPGELTIAETGHHEGSVPETNAATPEKTDVSVVSTEEASSNVPMLIFSCHSKHTDSNSLPTKEKDKSFAKSERENQEIDSAVKTPSELIGPSDDDTEVQNNNVTSPTPPDEPIRLVYDWFIFGWPMLCKVVHLFLESGLWHNQNLFCVITLMNFNLCCSLSCFRKLYMSSFVQRNTFVYFNVYLFDHIQDIDYLLLRLACMNFDHFAIIVIQICPKVTIMTNGDSHMHLAYAWNTLI